MAKKVSGLDARAKSLQKLYVLYTYCTCMEHIFWKWAVFNILEVLKTHFDTNLIKKLTLFYAKLIKTDFAKYMS